MIEKRRDIDQEKITLRDAIKTYISYEIYNIAFVSLFTIIPSIFFNVKNIYLI